MNIKKLIALASAFTLALSGAALAEDVWNGTIGTVPDNSGGVITITTGAQLAALAQSVNNGESYAGQTIQLGDDINLNEHEWTPIGRFFNYGNAQNRAFSGTFDGAGHKITNMKVENNAENWNARGETAALFGYIDFPAANAARAMSAAPSISAEAMAQADAAALGLSGEAYDNVVAERTDFYTAFGVEQPSIQTMSLTPAQSGGIVKNLKVYGTVTNTRGQGASGIVCWNDGLVENCYFNGKVSIEGASGRAYVGGISSLLGSGAYVVNCAAEVDAKAYGGSFSYAGGIAGYFYAMNAGYVVNCSVEPRSVIDSNMDTGGVVGGFAYNVINCVSAADEVKVKGQIESGGYRGAIIGAFGKATNCFWLSTSAAQPETAVSASDTSGLCKSLDELPVGSVLLNAVKVTQNSQRRIDVITYPTGAAQSTPSLTDWTSVDTAVATVDESGMVTGISQGVTQITATASSAKWNTEAVQNVSVTPQTTVIIEEKSSLTYTITVIAGKNGTITPNDSITVTEGEEPKFEITADTGYVIDKLLVNGAEVSEATGLESYIYTFPKVTQDTDSEQTISVTFKSASSTEEPTNPENPSHSGGGSGGCNAGLGALALLAFIPLAMRRKKP